MTGLNPLVTKNTCLNGCSTERLNARFIPLLRKPTKLSILGEALRNQTKFADWLTSVAFTHVCCEVPPAGVVVGTVEVGSPEEDDTDVAPVVVVVDVSEGIVVVRVLEVVGEMTVVSAVVAVVVVPAVVVVIMVVDVVATVVVVVGIVVAPETVVAGGV